MLSIHYNYVLIPEQHQNLMNLRTTLNIIFSQRIISIIIVYFLNFKKKKK